MNSKQSNNLDCGYYCRVCNSEFIYNSRNGLCTHLCIACEVTLLQCPVCITNPENGNENISRDELNQAISTILESQQQSVIDTEAKNPTKKKTLKEQILKHCFLGVWDGAINVALKAFGVKSSKKNPILGNVQNTVARVGRQTGRSLFPNVINNISNTASIKLIGGLAAVLICFQILIAKRSSMLK
ncbi:unnamed protein product [Orchesella dallaii]|uniref:RING-type domain-containing protein n=1 Tax=Orchesella dallaii TaxID=48710 RepID=A0ABP1R3U8_9HEXA